MGPLWGRKERRRKLGLLHPPLALPDPTPYPPSEEDRREWRRKLEHLPLPPWPSLASPLISSPPTLAPPFRGGP